MLDSCFSLPSAPLHLLTSSMNLAIRQRQSLIARGQNLLKFGAGGAAVSLPT